jgi:hypothetical protein
MTTPIDFKVRTGASTQYVDTQLSVLGLRTPGFLGVPTEPPFHNTMSSWAEEQKPRKDAMASCCDTCHRCFDIDRVGNQGFGILCLPCHMLTACAQCAP